MKKSCTFLISALLLLTSWGTAHAAKKSVREISLENQIKNAENELERMKKERRTFELQSLASQNKIQEFYNALSLKWENIQHKSEHLGNYLKEVLALHKSTESFQQIALGYVTEEVAISINAVAECYSAQYQAVRTNLMQHAMDLNHAMDNNEDVLSNNTDVHYNAVKEDLQDMVTLDKGLTSEILVRIASHKGSIKNPNTTECNLLPAVEEPAFDAETQCGEGERPVLPFITGVDQGFDLPLNGTCPNPHFVPEISLVVEPETVEAPVAVNKAKPIRYKVEGKFIKDPDEAHLAEIKEYCTLEGIYDYVSYDYDEHRYGQCKSGSRYYVPSYESPCTMDKNGNIVKKSDGTLFTGYDYSYNVNYEDIWNKEKYPWVEANCQKRIGNWGKSPGCKHITFYYTCDQTALDAYMNPEDYCSTASWWDCLGSWDKCKKRARCWWLNIKDYITVGGEVAPSTP